MEIQPKFLGATLDIRGVEMESQETFTGVTAKSELFIPEKRQKEGGTYFDDLLGKKPPTKAELNSLAIRQELNGRPGAHIYVPQVDLKRMQAVMTLWRRYKLLDRSVLVMIDDTLKPGTIQVRYP